MKNATQCSWCRDSHQSFDSKLCTGTSHDRSLRERTEFEREFWDLRGMHYKRDDAP